MYPFDTHKIFELACLSTDRGEQDEHADSMKSAVEHVLNVPKAWRKVKRRQSFVTLNSL